MAKVHARLVSAAHAAEVACGAEGKETVMVELTGVDTSPENGVVQLDGNLAIKTVAESTEVIVRIRRTSLTGTEIAKLTIKPGASVLVSAGINAQDEPGEMVNGVYVITLEDVAKKLSKGLQMSLQAIY